VYLRGIRRGQWRLAGKNASARGYFLYDEGLDEMGMSPPAVDGGYYGRWEVMVPWVTGIF